MKKLLVSTAIAFALLTGSAFAKQEVDAKRVVWELSDFPELAAKTDKVCASSAVMSPKLKTACQSKAFPKISKKGEWYNVGIGSELNTLIRNAQ
jgi:hypothetical protein